MKVFAVLACLVAVAAGKAVSPDAPLRKNFIFISIQSAANVQVQLVITKQKKEPKDLHFLLSQADVVQFEKKSCKNCGKTRHLF